MPELALKDWVGLIKDALLAAATLLTIVLGIYGVRAWKRDMVGKEIYAAAKKLLKESHLICRAAIRLREPIQSYERRTFTDDDIKHTTENERWRTSEADAYRARVEKFAQQLSNYEAAKLELRVLVGSKIYNGLLPLDALLGESINSVNSYLDLIRDNSKIYLPDSSEILEAKKMLYPRIKPEDDLTRRIWESRETCEETLLRFLHRNSIRG